MTRKSPEQPVRTPTGFCIMWGCGKPLRDENGKRLGNLSRGLCWTCYKQAQRAGDLTSMVYPRGPGTRCSVKGCKDECEKGGMCNKHYCRKWRKVTPTREQYLARKRKYAREHRKRNENQLGAVA